MQKITLTSFTLAITGLTLSYSVDSQTTTRNFCPFATCSLLQDLGLIEGFDQDENGEPVILFTDSEAHMNRTGFSLWYQFAATFHITHRMAEIIADRLHEQRAHIRFQSRVNSLLQAA